MRKVLSRGVIHIAILLLAFLGSVVAVFVSSRALKNQQKTNALIEIKTPTPTVSPTPISNYVLPVLKRSDAYTIVFVGDSMVDVLGENFDYLRQSLEDYYQNLVFGLFNYGYGSTNILTLEERLNQDTVYRGKKNEAVLDRFLDVIVIGSFGHNPLSDLSLDVGLKKQEEVLDRAVLQLVTEKPNTLIIFLAEFAPSEANYGRGVVELTPEQRSVWVSERKAYIENHIEYAKNHNIPLINIYEESTINGEVDLDYINKDDYIHPSSTGLVFMSQKIADFLHNNSFLP